MKKIIKILQSNIEPLIIEDENDSELNEYVSELSNLLLVGNVTILETSSSSVIIRPHQITSIIVTEEGKRKRKYKKRASSLEKPKETEAIKETETVESIKNEDVITDE